MGINAINIVVSQVFDLVSIKTYDKCIKPSFITSRLGTADTFCLDVGSWLDKLVIDWLKGEVTKDSLLKAVEGAEVIKQQRVFEACGLT